MNWLDDFKKHRDICYPNECVGIIDSNDNYIALENTHNNPTNQYRLDGKVLVQYNVKAICHSHTNGVIHPSYDDTAIMTAMPSFDYYILVDDKLIHYSRNNPAPLLGREFIHYVADCYGLIRDYYYNEGIILNEYPRSYKWWDNGQDVYRDGIASSGFVEIDEEPIEGDCLLMQINAPVPNHAAVYVGDGLIIQHFVDRLSRKDDYNKWKKYIVGVYRYAQKKKD